MQLLSQLLSLLLISAFVFGEKPHWVFFDDSLPRPAIPLSSQAEQRIMMRGNLNAPGSQAVAAENIQQLHRAGFIVRQVSVYLNAASVEVDNTEMLQNLYQLPRVKNIQPVAKSVLRANQQSHQENQLKRSATFAYGDSYTQNQMLNIPDLHDRGYDASGVTIGIFDTGFKTTHPAFDQVSIVGQHDFVDQDNNADVGFGHGEKVLSVLGGYVPGELIGPAYGANYLLARTEDEGSETRIEEDNWVAAMEWADALGVDIISSSLNYFLEHDDPSEDYPPSALDGATTIISKAANIAAQRGILVVNSMGNEGPGSRSVWPPADSPHVLSVGSVNADGIIDSFSGRGPTYDNRIKPEVVAMGRTVRMVSGMSGFTSASGTSFSTPQIAGLAALLLQAQPTLSPDSIISIFREYGDRGANPDNSYGYGIPDLTSLFSTAVEPTIEAKLIYPNPCSGDQLEMVLGDSGDQPVGSCELYDIGGRNIAQPRVTRSGAETISIELPRDAYLTNQLLFIRVEVGEKHFSGKIVYLTP